MSPDRMPYRQRSLDEVAEDTLELRQKVRDLNARLDSAPYVRVDLHAEQLDRVRADIETLVAGPYCELFSRESRPGWDCWGNQADKFEIAA